MFPVTGHRQANGDAGEGLQGDHRGVKMGRQFIPLPHDFEGGEGPAEPAAGADAGQEVQLQAGGEGGGGDF